MGIFSKKVNNELFQLLEADADDNTVGLDSSVSAANKIKPSHAITVSEVLKQDDEKNQPTEKTVVQSPIETLKKRMQNITHSNDKKENSDGEILEPESDVKSKEVVKVKEAKTLLQKCRPYIVDELGRDATTPKEPIYRLQSVAEILENDSKRTIEALSQKYEITVDNLSAGKKVAAKEKTDIVKSNEGIVEQEKEIYEEKLSDVKVKSFQTSLPDISDIDNFVAPRTDTVESDAETSTIRFTPIKGAVLANSTITVSTTTNTIDLTNELEDFLVPDVTEEEITLEESEFEGFKVKEEYTDFKNSKKLVYNYSLKKRASFLRVLGSFVAIILLACFEIPKLNNLLLSNTRPAMAVCAGIFVISVLINIDMFGSFAKIFSKKSTSDVTASFAAISTILYSAFSIFYSNVDYELILLAAIILFFRALGQFMARSALLGNLKQIANQNPKKAISLIMDEATTFAMAKDAIDGDVLVATPRDTDNITDFMKYSKFGKFMNGRLPYITVISLVLSLICGLAAVSLFEEVIYGLYTAAAVLCITASPLVFLIESLPLNNAAKKLNSKGAMIAGKTAAERLEMANAVVLSSSDLFPSGTVTLHSMKVLSENPIDDTLVRAASLTDAVNSPLSNIFKQIAGTNAEYSLPDSDTVKYEDKLGLSGWVDDELLFIGNRTLMEAHNISVPDVRVDKKILQKGYFPVYIASGSKAIALIVVQYSVDHNVVYELKRITDAGVTLLVNNCDPNLTTDMICDYLGLYEDSVRIMSNAGVHMYKNAIPKTEVCSAPAAFKGKAINFISVMNCAARIKKSIILLNILYVLAFCFGIVLFAYLSFSGGAVPLTARSVMLYELGVFALTLLIYQGFKP